MVFKDLHLRFKAFRLRKILRIGKGQSRISYKRNENQSGKKPLWVTPISHGLHVVKWGRSRSRANLLTMAEGWTELEQEPDSVVAQREQVEGMEVWLFGVSDAQFGEEVTKYLYSNLLDKNPKKICRSSKEAMRKAYMRARAKTMRQEEEESHYSTSSSRKELGSASAIVINGEKLVVASTGDYGAVVCRDGLARYFNKKKYHRNSKWKLHRWSRKLIPGGAKFMPRVRTLVCKAGGKEGSKQFKSSGLVVGSERIDAYTEFVVLASTGIWEVMGHQEAVDLVRHIEDPQEAAECLAKEALIRMSRSTISCIVIRFE